MPEQDPIAKSDGGSSRDSADKRNRSFVFDAVGLLLLWLALLAVPWLMPVYPTNDDFLYARSVEIWQREGKLVWVSHNGQLPAAALWLIVVATAAAKAFGFSFELLAAVNLTHAWLGLVALFVLARRLGTPRKSAWFLILALLVNPFYLAHSVNFMTDNPALAWCLISLSAFVLGIKEHRLGWLFVGSVAASIGIATRQTSLFVLILPMYVLTRQSWQHVINWNIRSIVHIGARAVMVLFLPAFTFLLFERGWFGPPLSSRTQLLVPSELNAAELRRQMIVWLGGAMVIGMILLPMACHLIAGCRFTGRHRGWWRTIVYIIACLPLLLVAERPGRLILTETTGPFLQNAHLGPVILSSIAKYGDMGIPSWPTAFWFLMTIASLASLPMFVKLIDTHVSPLAQQRMEQSTQQNESDCSDEWITHGLLFVSLAMSLAVVCLIKFSFDRYWLSPVAPLIVLLITIAGKQASRASAGENAPNRSTLLGRPGDSFRPASRWIAIAVCVVYGVMTTLLLHDHLAFNHARWTLARQMEKTLGDARLIDAGYEFNGWHRSLLDPNTPSHPTIPWWAENATHHLDVEVKPGYVAVAQVSWASWATGFYREAKPPIIYCVTQKR